MFYFTCNHGLTVAGGRRQRGRECRCSSRHDWTPAHGTAFSHCRQTAHVALSTAVEASKTFRSDSLDVLDVLCKCQFSVSSDAQARDTA